MTAIVLPSHFRLHASIAVQLVVEEGRLAPEQAVLFPAFFAIGHELANYLPDDTDRRWLSYLHERMPVLPTERGLVFDTDWAPFGALATDCRGSEFERVLEGLERGAIAWDVTCPAMSVHSSLLAHVIRQYGAHTGANPDKPGMNEDWLIRKHPIVGFLQQVPAEHLARFLDRDDTLLDLAFAYHQWELAEFAWARGARWSAQALSTGKPLEALVVATQSLQGSLSLAPNDAVPARSGSQLRLTWLATWLDRYTAEGGAADPPPTLDYRARLAQARQWDEGIAIRDTPAGFWVSRFLRGVNARSMLPLDRCEPHVWETVATWVRFWANHRVDLMSVTVSLGSHDARGFRDFWKDINHADAWAEAVEALFRETQLDRALAAPSTGRKPRRL